MWIIIDIHDDPAAPQSERRYSRMRVKVFEEQNGMKHHAEPIFDTKKQAFAYMKASKLPKGMVPVRVDMTFSLPPRKSSL